MTLEVKSISVGWRYGYPILWVEFSCWPDELYGADPHWGDLCTMVGELMDESC